MLTLVQDRLFTKRVTAIREGRLDALNEEDNNDFSTSTEDTRHMFASLSCMSNCEILFNAIAEMPASSKVSFLVLKGD